MLKPKGCAVVKFMSAAIDDAGTQYFVRRKQLMR
jgi:hypothetical protein